MHILEELSNRYPQLLLPIEAGISETERFRDAVLRGNPVGGKPDFSFSPGDALTSCDTPAGPAEILFLADRADFVHAYRALGYRCEPEEIPPSVGAATIIGLINWEKIHTHMDAWLAAGHTDRDGEFRRFTSNRENYCDTLILLSGGAYSSVPADRAGLDGEEWIRKSVTIRKYHELTHFVCRRKAPEKKDALRDEIYADCIGLIAAFGRYDPYLAAMFLGIESGSFREGGRLSHYMKEDPQGSVGTARRWIAEATERVARAYENCAVPGWDALSQKEREEQLFALLLRIY